MEIMIPFLKCLCGPHWLAQRITIKEAANIGVHKQQSSSSLLSGVVSGPYKHHPVWVFFSLK